VSTIQKAKSGRRESVNDRMDCSCEEGVNSYRDRRDARKQASGTLLSAQAGQVVSSAISPTKAARTG
jgi:hypothetical protein